MHQISNFYTQVCTQKVKINYVLCLQYYGIRNFWYTKHNNLLSWDPIGRENFHLLITLADLERTVFSLKDTLAFKGEIVIEKSYAPDYLFQKI